MREDGLGDEGQGGLARARARLAENDEAASVESIAIDRPNLDERKARLTIYGSPISGWTLSKDGARLFNLTSKCGWTRPP